LSGAQVANFVGGGAKSTHFRLRPNHLGGIWGATAPQKIFEEISLKLLIFRAQKAVITPVIIGKSPKIDAWIDGASPCVEN